MYLFFHTGDIPAYWDNRPGNPSLHLVDLKTDSQEYKRVLDNFEKTMQKTQAPLHSNSLYAQTQVPVPSLRATMGSSYTSIVKIQRVQNLVLYAQFMAKKKEMDKNNSAGHQNEMWLFHGTTADTCPKINQQGFNRSFSGKNGMSRAVHLVLS